MHLVLAQGENAADDDDDEDEVKEEEMYDDNSNNVTLDMTTDQNDK